MASSSKQSTPLARDWRHRITDEARAIDPSISYPTAEQLADIPLPTDTWPEKRNEIPPEYTEDLEFEKNTTKEDSPPWTGWYA